MKFDVRMTSDLAFGSMHTCLFRFGCVLTLEQGLFPHRVPALLAWRQPFLWLDSRNGHVLGDTGKMSPSLQPHCIIKELPSWTGPVGGGGIIHCCPITCLIQFPASKLHPL